MLARACREHYVYLSHDLKLPLAFLLLLLSHISTTFIPTLSLALSCIHHQDAVYGYRYYSHHRASVVFTFFAQNAWQMQRDLILSRIKALRAVVCAVFLSALSQSESASRQIIVIAVQPKTACIHLYTGLQMRQCPVSMRFPGCSLDSMCSGVSILRKMPRC